MDIAAGRPGTNQVGARRAARPGRTWRAARIAVAAALIAGCAGQVPVSPEVSPPAERVFRAPYEAVWSATLRSLGVIPPALVDAPHGRIVTGVFDFNLPVQAGMGRSGSVASQILSVSMDILVRPTPEGFTAVQAQTVVHHSMLTGFRPEPGGPNSPEGDLFARISDRLNGR